MGQYFFSTRDVANIDIIDPRTTIDNIRLFALRRFFIFLRHNLVNRLDLFVAHGAPC